MGWVWRALIAALLLGGTVAVVPGVETYAAGGFMNDGSDVLRPAPNDNCPNSNPRKQKKCHYNNQDNVSNAAWSTDSTGASVQNGDLTIDLWSSAQKPVWNVGFQIAVTGNGAPISYIEFWADPPAGGAPPDDIAAIGRQHQDCGGAQPCTFGAPVVARLNGWYMLHAIVVDTNGRAAGTDWQFLASENARS